MTMLMALLCGIGVAAGFSLLCRIPTCSTSHAYAAISLSVIVPARNEEDNLFRLLQAITTSTARKIEVLVVDDESTDLTYQIAVEGGATVIRSEPLPASWTGKAWACYQGAQRASGDLLLFVDADTYFAPGGLECLVGRWLRERDAGLVMSLLPYHMMQAKYEQLSLLFYLMMAAGAGGFGVFEGARLFGQSLLIRKETYFSVGGHEAVRGSVLENLNLARLLQNAGHRLLCLSGRDALQIRMFPDGLWQMSDSWTKAFSHGASASRRSVLACSAVWIGSLWMAAIILIAPAMDTLIGSILAYLALSAQLFWFARQLGNYRLLTCLLYPLPLTYYCIIFARSALRRASGRKTAWRGREV